MFCNISSLTKAFDLAEDCVRRSGPDKRLRFPVVVLQVVVDGLLQFAHVGEGAPTNPSLGDFGKEALHLVQPAGAGGCDVQVITGPAGCAAGGGVAGRGACGAAPEAE